MSCRVKSYLWPLGRVSLAKIGNDKSTRDCNLFTTNRSLLQEKAEHSNASHKPFGGSLLDCRNPATQLEEVKMRRVYFNTGGAGRDFSQLKVTHSELGSVYFTIHSRTPSKDYSCSPTTVYLNKAQISNLISYLELVWGESEETLPLWEDE